MNKSDFFYHLPEELIAQHPLEPRDSSRMMVLSKENDEILHKHFYEICDYFNAGDCLILNNTRVLPARIYGTKKETGAVVEEAVVIGIGAFLVTIIDFIIIAFAIFLFINLLTFSKIILENSFLIK